MLDKGMVELMLTFIILVYLSYDWNVVEEVVGRGLLEAMETTRAHIVTMGSQMEEMGYSQISLAP